MKQTKPKLCILHNTVENLSYDSQWHNLVYVYDLMIGLRVDINIFQSKPLVIWVVGYSSRMRGMKKKSSLFFMGQYLRDHHTPVPPVKPQHATFTKNI